MASPLKRLTSIGIHRYSAIGLGTLLICLSSSHVGRCTNFTWTAPGSGDWTSKTNWSPSTAFPSISIDTATVNSSSPLTVSEN